MSNTQMADYIETLPTLVRTWRAGRGVSLHTAASEIGCAPSTLLRIERGYDTTLSQALTLLRWLDQGPRLR